LLPLCQVDNFGRDFLDSNKRPKDMKAIHSIQIMRAVAAWLVVYHHCMQTLFDHESSTALGRFLSEYGDFGVDIFFVISGFVIFYALEKTPRTAAQFLTIRSLRIVPAYWFYTAISASLSYFFIEFENFVWTPLSLAKSLFFLPHHNPSGIGVYPVLHVGWTLNYEMFFYVLMALNILSFRTYKFFATVVALAIVPVVWPADWSPSILRSTQLIEFAMGIAIGHVYLRTRYFPRKNILAFVFWLAFAAVFLLGNFGDYSTYVAAGGVIVAALCFEDFLRFENRVVRILARLGDISYSTYLCHTIILIGMKQVLIPRYATIPDNAFLLLATVTIGAVSWVSWRSIETGPYVQTLKAFVFRMLAGMEIKRNAGPNG